jgi:hypothetical protein
MKEMKEAKAEYEQCLVSIQEAKAGAVRAQQALVQQQ